MKQLFYPKLALSNLKKQARIYIPYLITCTGTIAMYYIISALASDQGLSEISGASSLTSILSFASGVQAVFSVIFLFYTNSFLLKRRKKEFGLYNILGMEKRHIARMIFFETLFSAAVSLILGLLSGLILSRLFCLVLLKILRFSVSITLHPSIPAIGSALLLFGAIFFLIFLNALRQIHLASPAELLRAGSEGEREPKTRWFLTVVGLLTLGGGYLIALTTESPLDAIGLFFLAVILVMIGTYCLFTAGSIALLKLLRKNRNFYYQTKHFTSVSGMLYRMKQNAVGLANICILSTAVLLMISTTLSTYVGIEDVLNTRFSRDISVTMYHTDEEKIQQLTEAAQEECRLAGADPSLLLNYRYLSFTLSQQGDSFAASGSASSVSSLAALPLEDYNRITGQSLELSEGEILLYVANGSISGDFIQLGERKLSIRDRLDSFPAAEDMDILTKTYYMVVKDTETLQSLWEEFCPGEEMSLSYRYEFDTDLDSDSQIRLTQALRQRLKQIGGSSLVEGRESSRDNFFVLYGGLLFIGIFLGLLFLMAAVLIIYYKQISEGYDDRERFIIMQKVGMSRSEVRSSIRSQVLTVFYLPLAAAAVHIIAAFKMVTKLLALLNLTNIPLFIGSCIGTFLIFVVIYTLVFALTSRSYYRIVSS